MSCKPSIQGPPGPTGPRGRQGPQGSQPRGPTGPSSSIQIFASAYSTEPQLDNSLSPILVNFDTNQYPPQGIAFDPTVDPTSFTILTSGTYLISWSLSFSVQFTFDVTLTYVNRAGLISPNEPLLFQPPFPQAEISETIFLPANTTLSNTLTGTSNLSLPAGTIIQLQAFAPSFTITDAMISIVRIGDFVPP